MRADSESCAGYKDLADDASQRPFFSCESQSSPSGPPPRAVLAGLSNAGAPGPNSPLPTTLPRVDFVCAHSRSSQTIDTILPEETSRYVTIAPLLVEYQLNPVIYASSTYRGIVWRNESPRTINDEQTIALNLRTCLERIDQTQEPVAVSTVESIGSVSDITNTTSGSCSPTAPLSATSETYQASTELLCSHCQKNFGQVAKLR